MRKPGSCGRPAPGIEIALFDDKGGRVEEPQVPEALFALENVVLQPHLGSATQETRIAMGQLMVDNLKAHFAGKPLLTPVV